MDSINISVESVKVEEDNKESRLENIALYFIIGVAFLLPIFFIPSLSIPFQFTKSLLIFISILVAFFLFLISRLRGGRISLPRNSIVLVAWGLPFAYFISALFSGNLGTSFLGQGFEIDTFGFIAVMVLMLSLVPLLLKSKERVFRVHIALLLSFAVLAIFQGLRLVFGADFLSFGIFTNATSNLLGKWNDMAIFFGLTTILSLITLEGLSLNRLTRNILSAILVISLFFLAIVNFFAVWITVGLFALGLLIYSLSKRWRGNQSYVLGDESTPPQSIKRSTLIFSIVTLAVALTFIIGGASIGGYISSVFNISQVEARPSWQSTTDITKRVYDEHLLFGSGPNTFVYQWTLFKPQVINNTLFWNIDFASGVGLVPTSFVTTGIIGGLAWIAFFIFFIYSGVKTLMISAVGDRTSYYLSLSLFLGSLYLWIFTIIYIPNVVIVTLAFLLTGMYVASLRYRPNMYVEKEISVSSNPRLGFITVLVLTVLIIISGVSIYSIGTQYFSAVSFQKALIAVNINGDIDEAEKRIEQAVRFGENDRYYRLAAELNLVRINQIVTRTDTSTDEKREQFQLMFAKAISNAQEATQINQNNYQNWTVLGSVYGSVVPLGIDGAYESAKRSYGQAQALNPNSPAIDLTLARLELARNDVEGARQFISSALAKKNNYTEAIFLLSQIEIQLGNVEEAIRSAEAVTILEPNNPVFFFQLGLLQYNIGDNEKSIGVLERAVALNSQYSNARYFLGLGYYRTGRIEESIEQFNVISDLNPDNEEVKLILANLKDGKNPFAPAGIVPLENRDSLPIEGE